MATDSGDDRALPEGYAIPSSNEALLAECDVQVFRSSGPGGQSVNTTDSAVRLVHRPTGIRVQCQRERSQLRNKTTCLRRLRERLVAMGETPVPRVSTKPSAGARKRRIAGKTQRSGVKRLRQRPLDEDDY